MKNEKQADSSLISALRSKSEAYKEDMDMEEEGAENETSDDEVSELLAECKTPEERMAKIDSLISKLQSLKKSK